MEGEEEEELEGQLLGKQHARLYINVLCVYFSMKEVRQGSQGSLSLYDLLTSSLEKVRSRRMYLPIIFTDDSFPVLQRRAFAF
jgi:hypothetical protein